MLTVSDTPAITQVHQYRICNVYNKTSFVSFNYCKEIKDNYSSMPLEILVPINATVHSSITLCMILPGETFDKIYRLSVHLIFASQGNRKYVAQSIKVFNISLLIRLWHVSPLKGILYMYVYVWSGLKADRLHTRNCLHTLTDYRHTDKHLTVYLFKFDTSFFSYNSTNTHRRPTKPYALMIPHIGVDAGHSQIHIS